MNRKITYALNHVKRMREFFAGSKNEADINELADKYEEILNNPNGVKTFIIDAINNNINSLGIR